MKNSHTIATFLVISLTSIIIISFIFMLPKQLPFDKVTATDSDHDKNISTQSNKINQINTTNINFNNNKNNSDSYSPSTIQYQNITKDIVSVPITKNSSIAKIKNINNTTNSNNTESDTDKNISNFINNNTIVYNESNNVQFDKFGIKMLYMTEQGGGEWFMNMAAPTDDRQFNPKTEMTRNDDGSWKITSKKVRLDVDSPHGSYYNRSMISTYDQNILSINGYMQSPHDWKNVEMTGYVKVNSYLEDDNFTWYARGGKHNTVDCEGTAYKGGLFYSGKSRFAKEQWYPGGYSFTKKISITDSIKGEWVGFKFVMYNFEKNNTTAVKLENWIDRYNNGIWKKIDETIDYGGWGEDGTHCKGDKDQIITWGGPIATFRWDSAIDVDIKNLSVREIRAQI